MKPGLRLFLLGSALLLSIAACVLFEHRRRTESRPPSPAPVVSGPAIPPEEPVYDGKPLSYWVTKAGQIEEFNGVPEDAVAAIRAIGPKAVPFLLNWMPRPETLHQYADRSVHTPGWDAVEFAWWALGPDGKSAIPVLARIINQPQHTMDDYTVWTESAKAISYLGPDAIAPMLITVTNMQGK